MTRGPHSAGVYWRRRLVLLSVATILVVGLARLLGGSSDGSSSDAGVVEQAAAAPTSAATSQSPSPTGKGKGNRPSATPTTEAPPPLAVPDGPCVESDVVITPSAVDAVAGRDVVILLALTTIVDPACTWRVSSGSLSVKLTSGDDDIWSSQQCPSVVPVKDVIVRSAEPTTVALVWNAKRSDEDCSRLTEWAEIGDYHVIAAALGGEPTDVQFTLEAPVADVITETATPTQQASPSGSGSPSGQGSGSGSVGGSGAGGSGGQGSQPSGAVEPNGR
ncbi:hypothetical protein NPS01_26990 [Nocardioides psychrotolerans]|uniref:Uncharacterized protein n=2 Tax=Nocardioides psychrotolerans TaxID=1005945 RepID=A0A1I3MVM1_9ACTN|nr:hypothetical protein NPS01_26990 [Nocardioides psychrotolerans]SFJ01028.1 hypothetical protein SAMN05216561_11652 [Nocardioides psychrotolerans]